MTQRIQRRMTSHCEWCPFPGCDSWDNREESTWIDKL